MKQKQSPENDFLKETLKERPLNRRKLLRRMLITILMAVIFGTVASVTFLLLEPFISERLYPVEEPQELIFFPEDIIEEEILPEDMIADEREMLEMQQALEALENPPPPVEIENQDENIRAIAAELIDGISIGLDEYLAMNDALNLIAREAKKSLVTVTGLTSDVSWINTVFESSGQTTGVIVGATQGEVMVLSNISAIRSADTLMLTFINGEELPAEIKHYDKTTGLAILSVRRPTLDTATLEAIEVIELGSSASLQISGIPVIALGKLVSGDADAVCFGNVTSTGTVVSLVDASYRMMTTDIYGSTNASGILINTRGQVIGIIDSSFNTFDARNIVSALGISELKRLIESMCNNLEKPYVGIKGTDVTNRAHEELNVPKGAYITEVLVDTPAMEAGLQSGDIIIGVAESEIISFSSLVSVLFDYRPEEEIPITAMRQGLDGYVEFEITIVGGRQ